MLNKSREEVLYDIQNTVENNLDNIYCQKGNWCYSSQGNSYYSSYWDLEQDTMFRLHQKLQVGHPDWQNMSGVLLLRPQLPWLMPYIQRKNLKKKLNV